MALLNHTDTSQTVYDIRAALYWDGDSLDAEMNRVFDICTGCRLCWNLCPSFPALFDSLDTQADARRQAAEEAGEIEAATERTDYLDLPEGAQAAEATGEALFTGTVEDLTQAEKWQVVDLCYQCKLCESVCPYTPDKEHDFQLDFPRLMLRSQAVRTRRRGRKLGDKILARTDASGRLGSLTAPFSNWGNRLWPVRYLMEKFIGISRRRQLPDFHRQTFAKWFRRHRRQVPIPTEPVGKAVIFATCYTNANDPGVGREAVEILEHSGVEVQLAAPRCCGAPYLSTGDFDGFTKQALPNISELAGWVDRGYQIVVTGPPTCSLTLRQDSTYLDSPEAGLSVEIAKVAAHTVDISQYLMSLHKGGSLRTDFVNELGEINYHLPCHLKAQRSGYKSRDLLNLVPGTTVNMIDKCSGMDGGWGMRTEFFDASMAIGKKLVAQLQKKPAQHTCSDCSLAGLQIRQASGGALDPQHPVRLLHHAYGLDS